MACPNKVQVFAWRLAHNILPLKRKIESRNIELDTRCPMCYRLDEDAGHLLFKCKYAKKVWRQMNMEDKRAQLANLHSAHEIFMAIWENTEDVQTMLITTLWTLWIGRNAVNAGESQRVAESVSFRIQKYVAEFLEFFSKQREKMPTPVQKWKKPACDYLKINIDGSFF